jgi:hypothetical protein
LEFDKTGWWWYRDLIDEAVILEIVPPTGSEKLRAHVNEYGDNILQTVGALNELWHPCLAADYDYKNDRVTQVKNTMDKKLKDLFNARNDAVNHLVNDFVEPRRGCASLLLISNRNQSYRSAVCFALSSGKRLRSITSNSLDT